MRRRTSLADGLALRVTALVAVVLAVAGAGVTVALRGFLVDRVDQQLVELAAVAPTLLFVPSAGGDDGDEPEDRSASRLIPRDGTLATPDAVAVIVGPDGRVLARAVGPGEGDDAADPQALAAIARALPPGEPVDADLSGRTFRVLAEDVESVTIAVSLPVEQVQETVTRLMIAEVIVGLVAVLLVAVGTGVVVRRGLRPLARIAGQARDLAATDLSHPRAGERDSVAVALQDPRDPAEVASLAGALEAMLGHIDASLAARDEAEARLRRFVADASHELRTPLQSIRGYAELQRRGMVVDAEQSTTIARRVEEEAARMGRLVDDLLLLARLDQGRPLAHADVDLTALALDAVADAEAAEAEVPAGRHPVSLDLPSHPVVVVADVDRLRQVLANLLANARLHTPPGTPVTVSVRADGPYAVLSVSDEGPGIPPEAQPHVFERFYRVDVGRSRDRGGSGLGLSLVQSIATALGGGVSLRSDPSGTRIDVRLPLSSRGLSDPDRPVPTPPGPPAPGRPAAS